MAVARDRAAAAADLVVVAAADTAAARWRRWWGGRGRSDSSGLNGIPEGEAAPEEREAEGGDLAADDAAAGEVAARLQHTTFATTVAVTDAAPAGEAGDGGDGEVVINGRESSVVGTGGATAAAAAQIRGMGSSGPGRGPNSQTMLLGRRRAAWRRWGRGRSWDGTAPAGNHLSLSTRTGTPLPVANGVNGRLGGCEAASAVLTS